MGDIISHEVNGVLYYVPSCEFERVLTSSIPKLKKAEIIAGFCRINTLYMIAKAGSGHIGSSFSSMDILTWLYFDELKGNINNNFAIDGDIFFSSKGHDAPALYSVLIGFGKIDFEFIHNLRRLDGLPGHPDVSTPNIITNTGSLGMGISKAKGMIIANRLLGVKSNVFVLTGDGELQEGQIWESLLSAVNNQMSELTVIIDHNKLQSDTLVENVSSLGEIESKFSAFGWNVFRCDGNNINEFSKILKKSKENTNAPKVIIADTIKGKGVPFMEHTSIDSDIEYYKYHSGAPNADSYNLALNLLIDSVNNNLLSHKVGLLNLEKVDRSNILMQSNLHKLIPAYSKVLVEESRKNNRIVALNADLILDTGLIPFKEEFPNRFIECGIAEQDMVSQAGGMALRGLIPIVHSFGCFLSSRPNEQIYNNATELSKIIYVGSLSGLIPAGPGHSHQAVRDIASLSAIPGLTIVEPFCEDEVASLLKWALENQSSSYIRLVSVSFSRIEGLFNLQLKKGRGTFLKNGEKLTVITSGPIFGNAILTIAEMFMNIFNLNIKIIITPWLNTVDTDWYRDQLISSDYVAILDNHYVENGLGTFLTSQLCQVGILQNKKIKLFGLKEKPKSGQQDEVLEYHKLDTQSIFNDLLNFISE